MVTGVGLVEVVDLDDPAPGRREVKNGIGRKVQVRPGS
jgi:hypothetical protein